MPRKKKISFQLDPEWLLKEPIDFEYNKYTLLDYIQKCEQRFENLEIYPDFVELSLHLANLQSLMKENTLLLTDKKFNSPDDEILLKELYAKKPREMSHDEKGELERTINFSGNKLFDTFNIGKSVWNLAFDNIFLNIRKNKEMISSKKGFSYFHDQRINKIYIWEYEIKKERKKNGSNKTILRLIHQDDLTEVSISQIILQKSTWKESEYCSQFPIFEVKSKIFFPMEQTFIPMMKRKLMSFIFQVVNAELLRNFDSTPNV